MGLISIGEIQAPELQTVNELSLHIRIELLYHLHKVLIGNGVQPIMLRSLHEYITTVYDQRNHYDC
jgi:hypothetical protein